MGSITLSRGDKPTARRGFDVVSIYIPLELELRGREPGNGYVLSDLAADIRDRKSQWLLGSGSLTQNFMPARQTRTERICLDVRCSPRALAQYEVRRNGGPVELTCQLSGNIHSLINMDGEWVPDLVGTAGPIDLEFSREDWTSTLRSCGLSGSVLIEIPFPLTDADISDPGVQALHDAFEAFEHGGSTAWKSTITHIRPYLEKWREVDPRPPADAEPKDGSPADRKWKLLNLRDALHKCCHLWEHESKSACTRQDALLVLSTFASLLRALSP